MWYLNDGRRLRTAQPTGRYVGLALVFLLTVVQGCTDADRGEPNDVGPPPIVQQILPADESSVFGVWTMGAVGQHTTYDQQGSSTIRTDHVTYAAGGFLQIDPAGTYVWKLLPSDPPEAYLRGRWRDATQEEMRYNSGEGVVLLGAYEGADWLVTQRAADVGGGVTIAQLNARYLEFLGSRPAR